MLFAVSKHESLQVYSGEKPALGPGTFVAPNASVIGNVTIGQRSSVWYGAILRGAPYLVHLILRLSWRLELTLTHVLSQTGDVNRILIGENSTILDGVVVHVARHNPQGKEAPTIIGNNVTIGAPFTIDLPSNGSLGPQDMCIVSVHCDPH